MKRILIAVFLSSILVGCSITKDLSSEDDLLEHGVNIDQTAVNIANQSAISFTFINAELGTNYSYSIDDTNAATNAVTGSGTIANGADTISALDLSGLDDDVLTLTVNVIDGSLPYTVTRNIQKDTVKPAFTALTISPPAVSLGGSLTFNATTAVTADMVCVDLSVLSFRYSTSQALVNNGDRTHTFYLADSNLNGNTSTGSYKFIFTATDSCENTATASTVAILL